MAASEWPCASGRYDPEAWFPLSDRESDDTAMAVSLCFVCPIQYECLVKALDRGERWGIWGGTTPHQRRSGEADAILRTIIPASASMVGSST